MKRPLLSLAVFTLMTAATAAHAESFLCKDFEGDVYQCTDGSPCQLVQGNSLIRTADWGPGDDIGGTIYGEWLNIGGSDFTCKGSRPHRYAPDPGNPIAEDYHKLFPGSR